MTTVSRDDVTECGVPARKFRITSRPQLKDLLNSCWARLLGKPPQLTRKDFYAYTFGLDMEIYGEANRLTGEGQTIALVTITAVEGSTPREIGTSMIVTPDGDIIGTIGGGTVEELTRKAAIEAIEQNEPTTKHWELEPSGNTGMVCGGEMSVFINVLKGNKRLVIAGGGHIARPLHAMAAELGYEVHVIEDREEYAQAESFPRANVYRGDFDQTTLYYEEGFEAVGVTDNTAVAVATRSGTLDRIAAYEGLTRGAFYVGAVASETKAERIREGLRDDGIDESLVQNLHSPTGLDIGGDTPAEIALSILAEITKVRHRASGESLVDEQTVPAE